MIAKILASLLCLAWVARHTLGATPDITFLCDRTPEICSNMCWAMRCADPSFPSTLTFDWPSDETKDARRSKGGCSASSNPCGIGRAGPGHRKAPFDSCNEYPFASTKEADDGPQVSRCVPTAENVAQAVKLRQLQDKLKKENRTQFNIVFGNPWAEGVRFCLNGGCDNDKLEVQERIVANRAMAPRFKLYWTAARMVIASMEEIELGSNYTREYHDDDDSDGGFPLWMENDDEHGDIRMIEDIIVEELPWDYFFG